MKFQPFMRVIKATMMLLTCFIMQAYATYGQRLTIKKENTSISDVLREIRNQSGYDFFYDANIFNDAKKINIDAKNADINEVLNKSFDANYTYTIETKIVTIRRNTSSTTKTTTHQAQKTENLINRKTVVKEK